MMVALYILYAIAQAILLARYAIGIKENEGPVLAVIMMAIFAPLVSVVAAGFGIHYGITWLVTYGKK